MKITASLAATLKKFKKPDKPQVRSNPFTGMQFVLEPEAVQLYDFITTNKYVCGVDYTRKDWDHARYYFAEKWPDEYFYLLD